MSDTSGSVPDPVGGGALLRQAREQAGVHVAALAVALKVPVRQLEALEQDRLDLLPDRTFARALAGSVCRHLKVDPTPILAALPQGSPHAVSVNAGLNEPFRIPEAPGARGWRGRLLRAPVLGALALLLGALALVFLPENEPGDSPTAPDSAGAAPAAGAAPGPASGMIVEQVTPMLLPATPAATTASVPVSAPASRPAPVPTPSSASAARQP